MSDQTASRTEPTPSAEQSALYKVLIAGHSCHGGSLQWSLPTPNGDGWTPGDWQRVEGRLVKCQNGIHVCTWEQAWNKWMKVGADIYRVETDAEILHDDEKSVTRAARLLEPVAMPDWWVKTQAAILDLQNVRWFKPDGDPLPEWKLFTAPTWTAARAAARAAAGDAARDAAWAAAGAAAWDAAWAAAAAAAGAAARAAARAAAGDAAGDAAWAAAGDAALYVTTEITCADLPIDETHRDYVRRRWQAWQKGYAVLCDVNGQLYVYAAVSS